MSSAGSVARRSPGMGVNSLVDTGAGYHVDGDVLLFQDEAQLYRDLKGQKWGTNLRLEQEHVHWQYAWGVIESCAGFPTC